MKDRFIQQFKEVLEIEDRDISLDDIFRDYDEWDSLVQLSLIAMLDEEFEVEIEEDDFNKLITVSELLQEVEKRSKA
jgi:acyl carrier protein